MVAEYELHKMRRAISLRKHFPEFALDIADDCFLGFLSAIGKLFMLPMKMPPCALNYHADEADDNRPSSWAIK